MKTSAEQQMALFFQRRSIRAFLPGDVSDETVDSLLKAGMSAPSAVAKDPWRFVVVRERATLLRIADALPYGKMLTTASLGIVVCGDIEAAHDHQLSYMLQDCSAAIENILLCAPILGLGGCWLGVHPREERIQALKEILSLPDSITPVSALAIGYSAEQKEPRTRFNRNYVHTNKW